MVIQLKEVQQAEKRLKVKKLDVVDVDQVAETTAVVADTLESDRLQQEEPN